VKKEEDQTKQEAQTRQQRHEEANRLFRALPRSTRILYVFCLYFTMLTFVSYTNSWLFDWSELWPLWQLVIVAALIAVPVVLIDERKHRKN
jgi:hypothetical protein